MPNPDVKTDAHFKHPLAAFPSGHGRSD